MSKYTLGISLGDPNGIGPEVVLKIFKNEYILTKCKVVLYGNKKVFSYWNKELGLNLRYNEVKHGGDAKENELNLCSIGDEFFVEPGTPSQDAGKMAFKSLERCVQDAKNGMIDAIVTAPLDKSTVNPVVANFTGHTDYLAKEFEVTDYMMLMVCDDLATGLVTTHVPLSEVSKVLSKELIIKKLEILNASLINDFGITKPKIAVLGLNPHAGDNGVIGKEEQELIIPAITEARENGLFCIGAYPSDGFFGSRQHLQFDGVLAMYHDQGLIPFKYISGSSGVNYTAGLTVVRTSPDHGTAYDIAGKDKADEGSMRTALFKALDILKCRDSINELSKNPLPIIELKREKFRGDF